MSGSPGHDPDGVRPRTPRTRGHRPGGAGEADATEFTAFYRRTTKPLVAFLVNQGATLHEAADIAQDTMAKLFQHWHTVEHPRGWVFRVAGRAFVRLRVEDREVPTAPLPPSPLVRDGDTAGWELNHDLVRALDRLSSRQRQVMAWHLAGYTPAETAEVLALSDDAVRQHLLRARRALSTWLSGKEPRR